MVRVRVRWLGLGLGLGLGGYAKPAFFKKKTDGEPGLAPTPGFTNTPGIQVRKGRSGCKKKMLSASFFHGRPDLYTFLFFYFPMRTLL